MYKVAADIGGTFTDVVVVDESGQKIVVGKSPTTTDDLQQGVLSGLDVAALAMGVSVDDLLGSAERFVHATTQSSNAVFAGTGTRTAVLTTRGFGDTLIFMRATGRVAGLSVFERHHYRNTDKPTPLADERDIFEITERVDHRGRSLVPLDEADVRRAAAAIADAGYGAVAVCFLFSHKNAEHEHRAGKILAEALPGCYVSLSSDVAPVIGEYERSATTLFNAYVGPVIESYLVRLEHTLADAGLRQKLLIVQANGGVATAAQTVPIMTVESGPAAGVVGSAFLAEQLGYPDVIATDVGGTTFKVAVIENHRWSYAKETVLKQYQLRVPMLDIASIGAGGGSIAWVDSGRLRVGPRSAAANPGPACYGLGGVEPTVTDADVVLGYISPDRFLDGRMPLDAALAESAMRKQIAGSLFAGDVLAAAAGVRQVIDNQMADLIRKSTLERGHDARKFVMMAYGGAGPTHAGSYAAAVGVPRVIVPANATAHSAYGAALTDVRFSLRTSDPMVLPVAPDTLEAIYARMENEGVRLLAEADVDEDARVYQRWVEARYRRQVHHLRVPVAARVDAAAIDALASAFEGEYERLFGRGTGLADAGIELINYGVDAIGRVARFAGETVPARESPTPRTRRPAYCFVARAMVDTPVYAGAALGAGATIDGPAIIEQPGTTVVVASGQRADLDAHGHLHLIVAQGDGETPHA